MNVDVAIVGGGAVGGSLACALAGTGLRLALVEPKPVPSLPATGFDVRVYALNRQSRRFLDEVGVWRHVDAARVEPVLEMRVLGDDGTSTLEFNAYRSGVPELAAIVEEANLQQATARALAGLEDVSLIGGVECREARWQEASVELGLSDGSRLEAALVVGADGADSRLRAAAGMAASIHDYGERGVVANFRIGRPHGGIAYQWFRDDGVLAMLPLPDRHASMVWSTAESHADLLLGMAAEQLEQAVHHATGEALGQLRLNGPVRSFPLRRMRAARLVAPRVALLGDAAHNVHPLAGQGLNLGLGDAHSLAQALMDRGLETDCGAMHLLRRYERSRKEPVLAMEYVTDGLHSLFASRIPGLRRLRNAGLGLTSRIPPLKRMLVKRALG